MPVLAVDLDGTLLRSDMLHETLWGALAVRSRMLGDAILSLFRGRAALKAMLADNVTIDPATLPYDHRVLDRIKAWREKGGYVVLVTATDVRLARKVADHLGVFDAVHGSTADRNLKGAEKAALLMAEYGQPGVCLRRRQPGGSRRLVRGAEAITVGADRSVRRAVDAMGLPVEHIPARGGDAAKHHPRHAAAPMAEEPAGFRADHRRPGPWRLGMVLGAFGLRGAQPRRIGGLYHQRSARPRRRPDPSAQAQQALRARRPVGGDGHAHGAGPAAAQFGVAAQISWQLVAVVVIYFMLTMAYSLG
jgi:hypothetical protein